MERITGRIPRVPVRITVRIPVQHLYGMQGLQGFQVLQCNLPCKLGILCNPLHAIEMLHWNPWNPLCNLQWKSLKFSQKVLQHSKLQHLFLIQTYNI